MAGSQIVLVNAKTTTALADETCSLHCKSTSFHVGAIVLSRMTAGAGTAALH